MRWVVKAGSNLVCSGGPLLLKSWMQQVARLQRDYRVEVVWVTSGAIASAAERTGFKKRERRLSEKQALSAIGQPLVMDLYNAALRYSGLLGAQILLTYDDLVNRERRKNFQNTVEQLLKWEVMPVLNENDAVATDEIKFGDNDTLSAKVARVVQADRLIILSDVEGLYDSDPKKSVKARLIPHLPRVTPDILKRALKSRRSRLGTGGIYSKLKAAQEAAKDEIETWLVRGDRPGALLEIARNHSIGTRIGS